MAIPYHEFKFGETILSVLQKERDRKQEQEKLAQTMAFQERQFDLLNVYKQQNALLSQEKFKETQRHNKAMETKGSDKTEKMPNVLLPELSDNEADYYGTRTEKPMETTTMQTGEMEDILLGDVGYNYNISKKDYKPKGTTVNVTVPEPDDSYSDFATIDNMIGKYNKRTSLDKFDSNKWREDAYGELNKLIKGNNIGQSVIDKVFEKAGISDKDDPIVKREKLKNVISQLKGLTSNQIQTLYRIAEVRTR